MRWAAWGLVATAAAATYFPVTTAQAVHDATRFKFKVKVPAPQLPAVPQAMLPALTAEDVAAKAKGLFWQLWAKATEAKKAAAPVPTPAAPLSAVPAVEQPATVNSELEDFGQSTQEDLATYTKKH